MIFISKKMIIRTEFVLNKSKMTTYKTYWTIKVLKYSTCTFTGCNIHYTRVAVCGVTYMDIN